MIFARLLLTAVFVFTGLELHAEEDGVVFDFRTPFEFTYLDWKDQTTATDGGVRIQAPKNAGGAGIIIKRDLAVFAGRSPQLQLRINEGNQAEGINLSFSDADGAGHQFLYNLRGKPVGEPVELVPEEGAGLGSPNEIKDEGTVAGLALSQIRQFQLQGQWGRGQDKAIDITVVRLDLVEPDAPTLALRAALKERLAEEQARKMKAHSALIGSAETALKFAEGNSFGLTSAIPGLPSMGFVSYFSVPEMVAQVLPRAHYVTQDPRYFKGALRAANYSAGANPDNMTYTVGVGVKHPLHPLHLDTRVAGQTPPVGVTVYGQSDPAENYPFNQWVHTWFIGKTSVPDSYSWPAAEAYVDLPIWPAMTEYTITQSIGPTSYYWGYLAARPDDSDSANSSTEKGEPK